MNIKLSGRTTVLTLLAIASVSAATAQDVNLKWLGSDASKELGGYTPQRLKLSPTKPDSLKKAPAGLVAPLYSEL